MFDLMSSGMWPRLPTPAGAITRPATAPLTGYGLVGAFAAVQDSIDSRTHTGVSSDQVLAAVRTPPVASLTSHHASLGDGPRSLRLPVHILLARRPHRAHTPSLPITL